MRARIIITAAALAITLFTPERAVVASSAAQAAPDAGAIDPSYFASLEWRGIGPRRGGRSIAVAGSAKRPLEYYFGATGGGIWKTTDGGVTWQPVADTHLQSSSVGALAVSPSNPDVVYAGMGEVQLRGNIIQGDGVYKTTDGGKTWTHIGLPETRAIARIRVHPERPDRVWVAALGDPYAPSAERGVFRSTDGGRKWEKVLFRNDRAGAVDIALDPRDADVLYAALWEVFRTPHSLSSGGPGSGLFKSTDGGGKWTELTRRDGLPAGLIGKIGVSVSGADSKRVYAIVEAADGGVFSSDDGGGKWKRVNEERRFRQRAFYYTRIYADPKEKDRVYVLNTGFYRSNDAGKTYRAIRVPHGDNHDLWIAPDNPDRMINSNDGGGNVSVNGGRSWTDQEYATGQFYNVFTTRHVPYHVCGAQQDNSTACVPSNGTGDTLYPVGGGESGYIAPDPGSIDVFYAGSYGGYFTRYDRRTGQLRAVNIWPENPMGHSAADIRERFQWTFPIVFSPHDPGTLYAGSQHLWRTTSEGMKWERISGDLTRHDPSTLGPSGGPITLDQTGVETYATIFTIAPSRRERGLIWTGSDDGLVHVTRNNGADWQNVTPPELPPFSRVSLIEASPHDPATAYVAANRYQNADRQPYVFRTRDYGRTWTKIASGLPADDFARVIREDPRRAGMLYLGTERGVYISLTDGAGWQSLRLDLPITPVHGIVVEDNDLVIGTHGRGFYVLDNIATLRQLTRDATADAVHLFEPADAVRNFSRGVAIDYYLKSPPEKVTIEVLDAEGKVVRSFTGVPDKSDKTKPAGEAAEAPEGDEGGSRPAPPKVPVKAGLNRFMWDMRYAGATEFPQLIMWAGGVRGPLAPAGKYQVRLTANGETDTRGFAVRLNPALSSVTAADVRAQFELASQIRDRVAQANDAVIRLRALKDQARQRREKSGDAAIATAADALTAKLTQVEGEIYQYRNQSSQDPLNYPIKLNNKLAALQGVVEAGDGRPTEQSYVVFKELSARLDAELARLETLVKGDVAQFNTQLSARKLEPIKDQQ